MAVAPRPHTNCGFPSSDCIKLWVSCPHRHTFFDVIGRAPNCGSSQEECGNMWEKELERGTVLQNRTEIWFCKRPGKDGTGAEDAGKCGSVLGGEPRFRTDWAGRDTFIGGGASIGDSVEKSGSEHPEVMGGRRRQRTGTPGCWSREPGHREMWGGDAEGVGKCGSGR